MLARRPGALASLQPPDHVAEELGREVRPTALLDYEIGVPELVHRALAFPPVVPGETREAGDGHLEAPSRQAAETIPNVTDYAAERHLR